MTVLVTRRDHADGPFLQAGLPQGHPFVTVGTNVAGERTVRLTREDAAAFARYVRELADSAAGQLTRGQQQPDAPGEQVVDVRAVTVDGQQLVEITADAGLTPTAAHELADRITAACA